MPGFLAAVKVASGQAGGVHATLSDSPGYRHVGSTFDVRCEALFIKECKIYFYLKA
jgi:hypothetical protein